MNIALIVAGGAGQRMGQDIPKQFICVDNKPVIIYTLENFQKSSSIDAICVACAAGWEVFLSSYAKQFNIDKLRWIVPGGVNRFMSIYNMLTVLSEHACPSDMVIVYDAVRPIINDEIIEDALNKAKTHGAAVGVIPCYDTMCGITHKGNNILTEKCDRDLIFRGMGPDAISFGVVMQLFNSYIEKNNTEMPILDMLLDSGIPVAMSKSSPKCIKLTTAEDIELFQAILKYNRFDWLK